MATTASRVRYGIRAALMGGFMSGAADLIYAIVAYGFVGVAPITILQSIASGWLGRTAYAAGGGSALVGLLSHFFITCVAAGIYVVASTRLSFLVRRPVVSGAAFGIGVFLVMNYVVVPLSAAVSASPRGVFLVAGLIVHMFLVGVPIALITRWVFAQAVERGRVPVVDAHPCD
jgi:hypothetical protein